MRNCANMTLITLSSFVTQSDRAGYTHIFKLVCVLVHMISVNDRAVDYFLNKKLAESGDMDGKPGASFAVLSYHGDLNSSLRTQNLNHFRSNSQDKGQYVLVATDIAARGLDIPETNHVIMFDFPLNPTDYIHR